MEEDIRELLEPIARDFDVDVLDIKLGGSQHRQRLRITIDQSGGIDSDILARVSRALSLQLDAADMMDGRYELEVGSPGLDWPLRTAADFHRHLGEQIQAELHDGRYLSGKNMGPNEDGFLLLDDSGNEHHLGFGEVLKVMRQVDWKKASSRGKETQTE